MIRKVTRLLHFWNHASFPTRSNNKKNDLISILLVFVSYTKLWFYMETAKNVQCQICCILCSFDSLFPFYRSEVSGQKNCSKWKYCKLQWNARNYCGKHSCSKLETREKFITASRVITQCDFVVAILKILSFLSICFCLIKSHIGRRSKLKVTNSIV